MTQQLAAHPLGLDIFLSCSPRRPLKGPEPHDDDVSISAPCISPLIMAIAFA